MTPFLPVYLGQTSENCLPCISVFGYAPAQVALDEVELALLTPLPQGGDDRLHQVFALVAHVLERRADEQTDSLPRLPLK